MGVGVEDLGFRVQVSRFTVHGLGRAGSGVRVWGVGCGGWEAELIFEGFECRVYVRDCVYRLRLRFSGLGVRVEVYGPGVWGLGFGIGVWGLGFGA